MLLSSRDLVAKHLPGWRVSGEHDNTETGVLVTVERYNTDPEKRGMEYSMVYIYDPTGLVVWDVYICPRGYVRRREDDTEVLEADPNYRPIGAV